MHVATWHCRTPESKFTKVEKEMSIGQTPNHAKFCGDPKRSVQDIHDQQFVLLKKWAKIYQNHLRPATSYSNPSFQTSSRSVKPPWRKEVQNFLHPSIFWLPRGTPEAKGHRSGWWGTSTPPLATCKNSYHSDNISPR